MNLFNSQVVRDGFCLTIPKNTKQAEPLHFIFKEALTPHNKIVVEENAEVVFIEEYASVKNQETHTKTEIILHRNARARFYKIQNEHVATAHRAMIHIQQDENSSLNFFTLSKGGLKQEDKIIVDLKEAHAACHLLGFYLLKESNQEVQHHLDIQHAAEHGMSSMFYKGIVDNNAKALFRGKVKVNKGAQHIHTTQANHNLLLSKLAEVSSKPELEIYADNVKCTHGATVGELDADALFYLQSRGIEKTIAMQMLLNAFAEEVFNRVSDLTVRDYLHKRGLDIDTVLA